MNNMKNKKTLRILSLFILLALSPMLFMVNVQAETDPQIRPYASYYLDNYGAYVYPAGNSLIQVYFNVSGAGTMDELGALSIQLYECSTNSSNIDDWEWKTTFTYDSTPGMLSYNDDYHSGHVDYYGTAGKWYKAYVCIWGGEDGDGDTRYFWTSAKKAT